MDELIAEQAGYVTRGMKAIKLKVAKDFDQEEQVGDKLIYKEFPQPDKEGLWSPYPNKPGLELDPAAVKKYAV